MKRNGAVSRKATIFLVLLTQGLFTQGLMAQPAATAPPDAVHVLVSNGLRGPVEAVLEAAQNAIGHPLAIEYGTAVQLQARIEGGASFDAALLPRNVADALLSNGALSAETDIGRAMVGLEIRGDAPRDGDTTSAAGIKALLLDARQLRWLAGGASSATIQNMIAKLGIADQLTGRTATDSSDLTFAPVAAPGGYELVFNLNSELKPVNGWRPLGFLPQEFQVPVIETAGVGAKGNAAGAAALIRFLQGPDFGYALVVNGLSR